MRLSEFFKNFQDILEADSFSNARATQRQTSIAFSPSMPQMSRSTITASIPMHRVRAETNPQRPVSYALALRNPA
jgi:hypothetical protein